ncbi:MAG TPA: GNAT family N-acetyltransferase [Gemmatimonadales bacterium]|nr:GNAT family N-acetyltransferase [Gemmatimonadales bacterium]
MIGAPPRIRPARAADADALARLLGQLGYPAAGTDVARRLERMMGSGHATVLVAEQDGEVVGLATFHLMHVLNRARTVAWLTALVVDEAARGVGIGRALVDGVEAFAREAGCERLSVTTQEFRTEAHAFYARLGFEHTGRRFAKPL